MFWLLFQEQLCSHFQAFDKMHPDLIQNHFYQLRLKIKDVFHIKNFNVYCFQTESRF